MIKCFLRSRYEISNGTIRVLHTNSLRCLAFLLLRIIFFTSRDGLDSVSSVAVRDKMKSNEKESKTLQYFLGILSVRKSYISTILIESIDPDRTI